MRVSNYQLIVVSLKTVSVDVLKLIVASLKLSAEFFELIWSSFKKLAKHKNASARFCTSYLATPLPSCRLTALMELKIKQNSSTIPSTIFSALS